MGEPAHLGSHSRVDGHTCNRGVARQPQPGALNTWNCDSRRGPRWIGPHLADRRYCRHALLRPGRRPAPLSRHHQIRSPLSRVGVLGRAATAVHGPRGATPRGSDADYVRAALTVGPAPAHSTAELHLHRLRLAPPPRRRPVLLAGSAEVPLHHPGGHEAVAVKLTALSPRTCGRGATPGGRATAWPGGSRTGCPRCARRPRCSASARRR